MNIGKLVLRKPDDRAPADSSTLPKALDHTHQRLHHGSGPGAPSWARSGSFRTGSEEHPGPTHGADGALALTRPCVGRVATSWAPDAAASVVSRALSHFQMPTLSGSSRLGIFRSTRELSECFGSQPGGFGSFWGHPGDLRPGPHRKSGIHARPLMNACRFSDWVYTKTLLFFFRFRSQVYTSGGR